MSNLNIELSWGSIWRVLVIGAVALLFYFTVDIWVVVFSAIVISYGLNPLVNLFEKIRIPRVVGTIFSFILILLIFGSSLYFIIPDIIANVQILLERYFDVIAYYLNIDIVKQSDIRTIITNELKLFSLIPSESSSAFEFSKSILGNIALAISAFAIAFYLTIDHKGIEKFIKATVPDLYEDRVVEIINRARRKIGYWFQAQIGLSFIVGFFAYLGLYIIGRITGATTLSDNALVVALLAATFEIIPFVGPFFTGATAVIIAFTADVPNPAIIGLYVLVYFVVIQQLEGHVLIPTLMNRAVGLHPVAVLVSMLIGVKLIGIIGLLLAVPASVVIQEFVEDWSSQKIKNRVAS